MRPRSAVTATTRLVSILLVMTTMTQASSVPPLPSFLRSSVVPAPSQFASRKLVINEGYASTNIQGADQPTSQVVIRINNHRENDNSSNDNNKKNNNNNNNDNNFNDNNNFDSFNNNNFDNGVSAGVVEEIDGVNHLGRFDSKLVETQQTLRPEHIRHETEPVEAEVSQISFGLPQSNTRPLLLPESPSNLYDGELITADNLADDEDPFVHLSFDSPHKLLDNQAQRPQPVPLRGWFQPQEPQPQEGQQRPVQDQNVLELGQDQTKYVGPSQFQQVVDVQSQLEAPSGQFQVEQVKEQPAVHHEVYRPGYESLASTQVNHDELFGHEDRPPVVPRPNQGPRRPVYPLGRPGGKNVRRVVPPRRRRVNNNNNKGFLANLWPDLLSFWKTPNRRRGRPRPRAPVDRQGQLPQDENYVGKVDDMYSDENVQNVDKMYNEDNLSHADNLQHAKPVYNVVQLLEPTMHANLTQALVYQSSPDSEEKLPTGAVGVASYLRTNLNKNNIRNNVNTNVPEVVVGNLRPRKVDAGLEEQLAFNLEAENNERMDGLGAKVSQIIDDFLSRKKEGNNKAANLYWDERNGVRFEVNENVLKPSEKVDKSSWFVLDNLGRRVAKKKEKPVLENFEFGVLDNETR